MYTEFIPWNQKFEPVARHKKSHVNVDFGSGSFCSEVLGALEFVMKI